MAAGPGHHTRLLQQARALELRRDGHGIRTIAMDLDVGRSTAARRLRDALQDLGAETSEQLRTTVEHRLDGVLQRLHQLQAQAQADGNLTQELKILNAILACERDRVRLLGLAVPAAVVIQVEQGGLDAA
ncbi:hypothetical protein BX265_2342 [Streptomyces sp. TLI_235]|nr:hypothetical protein [Streptomyces sp. TLI_235]PBC77591.1 hypothetical protein BX265_2342 [Streptomyces sp. TLI_235]